MIEGLPGWIGVLFVVTTLATIIWFHAAARSRTFLIGLLIWAGIQSAIGLSGFYQDATQIPPRIVLTGVLPCLVFIVACFLTARGRRFIDGMDLRTLTWMHTIRIPVEVVLWLLVERQLLGEYMSVGGTNFDILSGITAPIVAYLAFRSGTNRILLLYWNVACTILLFNVVVTAALGVPSPIQQHSFDQPNMAVLFFPFNLLPTVVVPLVLFAHLVAFRKLRRS